MSFSMREKTALFIDGANLHGTVKPRELGGLGLDIDYAKILPYVEKSYNIVRAFYYTAIFEEQSGHKQLQPLVDFLNMNGYLVKSKAAKVYDQGPRQRVIKGNMDIEIAVDVMRMAKHLDHIFLFSGDGDFRYLVEAVQYEGVRVTVVSSLVGHMCSIELRRQADEFLELDNLREEFSRER